MGERNKFTSLYCGGGLGDDGGKEQFTSLYCGGGLADSLGIMEERNEFPRCTMARNVDLLGRMKERNNLPRYTVAADLLTRWAVWKTIE
jgi:hypothetical protein